MIKKIRLRFILFTMLVISVVLAIIAVFFLMISSDTQIFHRTIILVVIILAFVLFASTLISFYVMKPIRKSWQQQLDFTADASHELRSPLAVIQSNLEIVLDNSSETVASQEKWLRNIQQESLRMNKLVEDLLTLSRADCSDAAFFFDDFPIDYVISNRITVFEPLAASHQITFQYTPDRNIIMHGDSKLITQLFSILMDNSIKYMGRPGTISIKVVPLRNHIHITFSDNGIGMPMEETQKVFSRFYRIDKARSRMQNGSGLGLSIAKWIVEAHHGKITLTSELNESVTLHIVI